MDWAIRFLLQHGYLVVFVFVFAEQVGLPISAIPILLAAGAIAGSGRLSAVLGLGVALVAALLGDVIWYELGRRRGIPILNLLCRLSLEPDSCVRRTHSVFARHGARCLIYAKFVPGLATAAPPLAGLIGMNFARFLVLDGVGAILWAGAFGGIGFVLREELELIALPALRLGAWLLVAIAGGLALYVAWRYLQRRRFRLEVQMQRITPEELHSKIAAGEDIVVIDLRHTVEFQADGAKIPGGIHIIPEDVDNRLEELPTDREIALYCT
jgi:membrane protein DedA with SNARE-associated domain